MGSLAGGIVKHLFPHAGLPSHLSAQDPLNLWDPYRGRRPANALGPSPLGLPILQPVPTVASATSGYDASLTPGAAPPPGPTPMGRAELASFRSALGFAASAALETLVPSAAQAPTARALAAPLPGLSPASPAVALAAPAPLSAPAAAALSVPLPAFPGAEGFGASVTGGRGGQVIYVTTTAASGVGSLQWAIDQPGAKTILFKVSGLIDARIHLRNGDVTIAGQSSPGGITVRGFVTDETPFQDQLVSPPADFAENWILQHLRIRPGLNGPSDDGLRLRYTRNAIVDHVSVGNATDEAVEISFSNNITIQNSILAETLGGHSFYGGILMNYSNPAHGFGLDNISIHHNVFSRIEGRLPEASRESLAAANSTMNLEISSNLYWDPRFFIALGANTGQLTDAAGNPYPIYYRLNAVNNYFRTGTTFPYGMWDDQILREPSATNNQLFVSGNRMSLYPNRRDYELFYCCNDYSTVTTPDATARLAQAMAARHNFPSITYTPALDLPTVLPNRVGAWPRDPMDARLMQLVRDNRFDPTAPSLNPYGDAWLPAFVGVAPPPPLDTDNDGMPDTWEVARGLNPAVANNNATTLSGLGYTDLEVYLHELSARLTAPGPAPSPSIAIAPTNASRLEGNTGSHVYTFTLTRSLDTTGSQSVSWAVVGSGVNPANAQDFVGGVLPSGSVTFLPGEVDKLIAINVQGDLSQEADETFTVSLANPTNGATLNAATANGTILNDDIAPAANLAIAAATGSQLEGHAGGRAFTFTVTRSLNTTVSHSVTWKVSGSGLNPANGADFVAGVLPSGTLSFLPGEVSQLITVSVQGDGTIEENEGFTVTLSNPTNGAVLTTASAVGTILNDDAGTAGSWSRLFGTTAFEQAKAVAVASDGAIYLAGLTEGNLNGQPSNGFSDGFLVKVFADGTPSWSRLVGSREYDRAFAVATSSEGAVVVAGSTEGNLDGQVQQGFGDGFISRFQADGSKGWTTLLGTAAEDGIAAVTIASDGSVYVAGTTFGALGGQTPSGQADGFLTRLSASGVPLWTRLLGTAGEERATALARGLDGSLYVAGSTNGALHGAVNNGSVDAFLSKYDPSGLRLWTRLLGGTTADLATGLAVGRDGTIYVSGSTEGTLQGQVSAGGVDAFISKFDPNGTPLWTSLVGRPGYDAAQSVTLGANGNLFLAGVTEGSFDGQVNRGLRDGFLSQFSPDGTRIFTQFLGTAANDGVVAAAGAPDGSIVLTGDTSGALNGQANAGGSSDPFAVKQSQPTLPIVVMTATDASAGETSNPGQVTLTRHGALAGPLTVNLTFQGTASAADVGPIPATVSFLAGVSTAIVNLTVVDDLLVEGSETAIFAIAAGVGYSVGATDRVTITITDNDRNGTAAIDTLTGDGGRNSLNGLAGNDVLSGAAGSDQLNGGLGADVLTGGADADIFIVQHGQSLSTAPDRLTDFTLGSDRIDLLSATGAALPTPAIFSRSANSAATTIAALITSVFTDANGALARNQALAANGAALVVATAPAIAGTYLVINDATLGFQSGSDLLLNVTGAVGALPAVGAIPSGSWFV